MTNSDLDRLLAQYGRAAEGTSNPDPHEANQWHDEMHAAYKALRESEAGRMGIASLMSHEDPHVRCWAAAHSLQWQPESARIVLEKLRDDGGPCAFDAEMTIDEYDKGRLSYDY